MFPFIYYGSLIILIPGIIFSFWAQLRIKSTFNKYSRVNSKAGWTAEDMSAHLLRRNSCDSVAIRPIKGNLTDNYNPSNDVLSLSQTVYGKTSIAALGVAAHECGHAVQKHTDSVLLKLRSFLVPVTNISSRLAIPIAIIGLILEHLIGGTGENTGSYILGFGIFLYSLSTIFALITLPVEIDASRRAVSMLSDSGILDNGEIRQARKVLYAAALTYVAALLTSFLYLLRFILILSRFRRRD